MFAGNDHRDGLSPLPPDGHLFRLAIGMQKPHHRRTIVLPLLMTGSDGRLFRICPEKEESGETVEAPAAQLLVVPSGRLIGRRPDARLRLEAGPWIGAIGGLATCRTRVCRWHRRRFRSTAEAASAATASRGSRVLSPRGRLARILLGIVAATWSATW
jgi:hypothetical protein